MNAQNVAGQLTGEKTEGYTLSPRKLFPRVTIAVLSLLMNRAVLPGGYFPFGAAFIAAVPEEYAAIAAAGGVIGCLTDGGQLFSLEGLRHMASLLAIGGIRWALGELRAVNRAKYYPFFTALGGVLLTGSIINGTTGALASYSTLYFFFEGLMAGMAAMLFSGAAEALTLFDGAKRLSGSAAASLLVMFGAAFIPLARLEVFHLSPALILAQTAVLLVLPFRKETGGAVGGTAAGCLTAVARYSLFQGTVCPVAGLLAGYAARYGRVLSASVYIAVCLTGTLTAGSMNYSFAAEAAAAGILSCLIPSAWVERTLEVMGLTDQSTLPACSGAGNSAVVQKLRKSAEALSAAGTLADEVCGKLERTECAWEEEASRQAIRKVCGQCPCRGVCCGKEQEGEKERIRRLSEGLSDSEPVNGRDISRMLRLKCIREEEMLGAIRENRGYQTAVGTAKRKHAQLRAALCDQWCSMGKLLRGLGEDLEADERSRTFGTEEAARLEHSVREAGFEVLRTSCGEDRGGRRVVSLTLRETGKTAITRSELREYVGECLDCGMETPAFSEEVDGAFRVTMKERPRFVLEYAAEQHCCNGGKYCGDACEYFCDDEGSAYLLLSDGMGSGARAAVDGAMACCLFAELTKGGFRSESTARLVNAALMMKSDEESLSTIDCLHIRLGSGRAEFFKAGAAQSYHVRDGIVNRIDVPSLPLGILRDVDAAQYCLTLEEGDLIVMLSDGVPTDESGWFEKLLAQYDGGSCQRFAQFLLRRAAGRRSAGDDDDITVMVCAVRKNTMEQRKSCQTA